MENVGYQEIKNMGYHGIEVSMEYYRVGAALWVMRDGEYGVLRDGVL